MLRLPLSRHDTAPEVRIDGRRTYLRPPVEADWEPWARLREASRGFLTPWEPTWPSDGLSREAFRRRLRRYAQNWRNDQGYAFLMFKRDSDDLVGGITLSNMRRGVVQSGSLGYWVGAPHARQGLMTDGLAHVLGFFFDRLGLHRLEAACLPHNEASRLLLQRVGFAQEGYARQYLCINGSWQDHLLFAMLRHDPRPVTAKPAVAAGAPRVMRTV